jgi:hypothetical protein
MTEDFSYDVALSFADEQREDAHQLAEWLHAARYRVFYDKWEEHRHLGQSLAIRLTQVYEHEARFCVVLVSRAYVSKDVPRHELQAALARHMRERAGYILPVKYDETPIPGLASDTVYLDRRTTNLTRVAEQIRKRLGSPTGATSAAPAAADPWFRVYPSGYLNIVVVKGAGLGIVVNLDCHVTNRGPSRVTVQHLEARMTDPEGNTVGLPWTVFYAQSNLRQHQTGIARELVLESGESCLTGIQFAEPHGVGQYAWRAAPCTFDLFALVRRGPVAEHVDLGTTFTIRPTRYAVAEIARWSHAPDAVWRSLNDPDNAVGIPLVVESVSSRFQA